MEEPANEQLDFLKALDGGNRESAERDGNPAEFESYIAARQEGCRRNRKRIGRHSIRPLFAVGLQAHLARNLGGDD